MTQRSLSINIVSTVLSDGFVSKTNPWRAHAARVTVVVLCVCPLLILPLSGMLRQKKDTSNLHAT